MKLSKVIRLFDIFALYFVPSHKGDRYHRTVIGGFIVSREDDPISPKNEDGKISSSYCS